MKARQLFEVPVCELLRHAIWEFDLAHEGMGEQDESWVIPVEELPVSSLLNRVVAAYVVLANAMRVPSVLSNVSLDSARATEQFVCLSVARDERWFHLARYFDVDYVSKGPEALAQFLSMPIDEVFPISYDLVGIVVGPSDVLKGEIRNEPRERLTDGERVALALGI